MHPLRVSDVGGGWMIIVFRFYVYMGDTRLRPLAWPRLQAIEQCYI